MTAKDQSALAKQSVQTILQTRPEDEDDPWERLTAGQIARVRLREIEWHGLSWPYIIGYFFTVAAVLKWMDWSLCVTYWISLLGIRTVLQPMAQGNAAANIIKATGPGEDQLGMGSRQW